MTKMITYKEPILIVTPDFITQVFEQLPDSDHMCAWTILVWADRLHCQREFIHEVCRLPQRFLGRCLVAMAIERGVPRGRITVHACDFHHHASNEDRRNCVAKKTMRFH